MHVRFIYKNRTCKGSGISKVDIVESIKIPAGVKNDTVIKISQRGHSSENLKVRNGDLLVKILIEDNKAFKRDIDDLVYEVFIPLEDAMFGGEIEVPILLQNKVQKVEIKPSTQPNTKIKFNGLGFPKPKENSSEDEVVNTFIRGDQVVLIKVIIPNCSKLSSKEKDDLIAMLKRI